MPGNTGSFNFVRAAKNKNMDKKKVIEARIGLLTHPKRNKVYAIESITCSKCEGAGSIQDNYGDKLIDCPKCGGAKEVEEIVLVSDRLDIAC